MSFSTLVRRPLTGRTVFAMMAFASVAHAQVAPKVPARPTPRQAKTPVFPKITVQTLANGLRLAVLENHELPIVAVRVGLPSGTFLDGRGKEGAWALMVSSLREGTMTRSAAAIAEAAADLGAPITWTASTPSLGGPSFTASFTNVRSAWQLSLELLADMLVHPGFGADGMQRAQAALATTAARPTPQILAQRTLAARLYGIDHPYTRFATDTSIRAVTRDDVVALQSAYLRPQTTTIVVAGDVTPAEARLAVEKAFASWEKTGTTIEPGVAAPAVASMPTTIFLRDQPGAPQSFIIGGQLIPSRASADAAAIEAVAAVLGGASGGSRLFDAFRVARGLSYNPNSQILWRPEPQLATWIAATTVPTAKTDTAVIEWLRVVREVHGDRPLTVAELEFSRNNLVGVLPAQLETVDAVATRTMTVLQNGLNPAFYTEYAARMNSLTLAEVQSAAMKYLDPDHTVIVVVGDRTKLEAPLRATGIPVVIVDR